MKNFVLNSEIYLSIDGEKAEIFTTRLIFPS